MSKASVMTVESHGSAATLYVTGELTQDAVQHAATCFHRLPEQVRVLCVDLRAVRTANVEALRALEIALRNWRAARRGMSRVKLAQDVEPGVVAIRFAHQRWRRAMGAPRVLDAFRFRDHREGVVTRSLRERAGSETR